MSAMPTVPTGPTVSQALAHALGQGVSRTDAQTMMLHLVNPPVRDRAWLITHEDHALSDGAWATWCDWVERRAAGVPVAFLTGKKDFYGIELRINEQVLDPRPDTETLVDWALTLVQDLATPQILDLGTGSGAIALALAHHHPAAKVSAVDQSEEALAVALANAHRLGLQVVFTHSNWFESVAGRFDLIVSNPPYIAEHDPHLNALVHEPRQALVSGADGLDDLRLLIAQAPNHLTPGGWLLLEHGHDQSRTVRALLETRGFFQVQSRCDLAGIERCSGGQWPVVE